LLLIHNSCLDQINWLANDSGSKSCERAAYEMAPNIIGQQFVLQDGLLDLIVTKIF
jgi:hypothetical protein